MTPPLGNWLYPKSYQVAINSFQEVTYIFYMLSWLLLITLTLVTVLWTGHFTFSALILWMWASSQGFNCDVCLKTLSADTVPVTNYSKTLTIEKELNNTQEEVRNVYSITGNNDPVGHIHGWEMPVRARVKILMACVFCCSTAIIKTDSLRYLHLLADIWDVVGVIGLVLNIHIVWRKAPDMSHLEKWTREL